MSTSIVDYESHIGRGEEKELLRGYLKPEDFSSNSANFVTEQLRLIDIELRSIVVEASRESDIYWATTVASRDDYKGWESFCRIGTRVVFKDGTFSAEWFKNRYVTQDEGPKKVYSTYLRKGKGFAYPAYSFTREPGWVREQVRITDAKYARLRERAAALTTMRRALRVYASLSA